MCRTPFVDNILQDAKSGGICPLLRIPEPKGVKDLPRVAKACKLKIREGQVPNRHAYKL
jgi:hypothetical protein